MAPDTNSPPPRPPLRHPPLHTPTLGVTQPIATTPGIRTRRLRAPVPGAEEEGLDLVAAVVVVVVAVEAGVVAVISDW